MTEAIIGNVNHLSKSESLHCTSSNWQGPWISFLVNYNGIDDNIMVEGKYDEDQ